ncbi:NAD(P)/FAD-dependent oxidoreductase [Microvirga alba]|uniref:FAD-binding oxidoreductase n=1 Tax=Microvirga alba TaxID=2791025 RepID=A0A931FNR6_9HYPH|nr:FAD-binding oxidoreductase [Microvirga alba]MBF9233945.1 FAD-binding oxidoreductase [Microvirga alba]
MRITIVGAGIVGIATAHALIDEGHQVTLVDPGGRPGRATDANAGWIAHTDIMPLASPKVWKNLPRWLADPLGPLTVRPGYLPHLAPWLIRFFLASTPKRIEASIAAIRAINTEALPAWQRRLDALDLKRHLRDRGILSVWRSRNAFQDSEKVLARQRAFGISADALSADDIKRLEPALQGVSAGVLYADACHVSDPATLASELMARALDRGATYCAGQVIAIGLRDDAVYLSTEGNLEELQSDRVIIAAGAWSRVLAKDLGDAIPLDTERGYNATFSNGAFNLSRPIMFEGEGFVTTPLDSGDRVGGAVEFAGLNAEPNHRRTDAIVGRLRRFLPHLDPGLPQRRWMGFRPSIPDSLPVIGRARKDERVIYAFGHGHYGLTQAAVTAEMVAVTIAGRPGNVNLKLFSAQRF